MEVDLLQPDTPHSTGGPIQVDLLLCPDIGDLEVVKNAVGAWRGNWIEGVVISCW